MSGWQEPFCRQHRWHHGYGSIRPETGCLLPYFLLQRSISVKGKQKITIFTNRYFFSVLQNFINIVFMNNNQTTLNALSAKLKRLGTLGRIAHQQCTNNQINRLVIHSFSPPVLF